MGFVREPREYSCLGVLLALAVPFVLTAAISAIPVSWAPSLVGYGRAIGLAIVAAGLVGIVIQPWSWSLRVLVALAYIPIMFIAAAIFGLVSGCFIQGGAACP